MEDQNKPAADLEALCWTCGQKTGRTPAGRQMCSPRLFRSVNGGNNPVLQNVADSGPIPTGGWTITGPSTNTANHVHRVLRLNPKAETQTFSRGGFLMHGDPKEHPGCASERCVRMPRAVREQVWNSGDRDFEVVCEIKPVPAKDEVKEARSRFHGRASVESAETQTYA